MIKKIAMLVTFALATALLCDNVNAQNIQCIKIQEGSINDLELRNAYGHENCFHLENGSTLKQINVLVNTVGQFSHKISFVSFDPNGLSSPLFTTHSNNDGTSSSEVVVAGRNIAFGIAPTSQTQNNKHLSVSFFRNGDYGAVIATISEPPAPQPPPISGERCRKTPSGLVCTPLSEPIETTSNSAPPALCSTAPTIPAGKHRSFDIDKNLESIAAQREQVERIVDPIAREGIRAAVMVHLFAPNRPYDLKRRGHKFESSQEFGNYFYGMAAAKMGYSEQTTLKAGAVVQQYQNYDPKNNHPDANKLGLMFKNLLTAAVSGAGDNPDDPPQILAGHRAGSNCSTRPAAQTTPGGISSSEDGLGRGWQGGSLSLEPKCVGKCNQGGGSVWVGPIVPIPQK